MEQDYSYVFPEISAVTASNTSLEIETICGWRDIEKSTKNVLSPKIVSSLDITKSEHQAKSVEVLHNFQVSTIDSLGLSNEPF
jgi:hypothetical protein